MTLWFSSISSSGSPSASWLGARTRTSWPRRDISLARLRLKVETPLIVGQYISEEMTIFIRRYYTMMYTRSMKKQLFIRRFPAPALVTYLGVGAGVVGLMMALQGEVMWAVGCLALAGVCDMFDGKFARCFKRSKEEKRFGVDIDSLADAVLFAALPAVIFFSLGMTEWYSVVAIALFVICGITRLAVFNAYADEDKPIKYYRGMPITMSAVIVPVAVGIGYLMDGLESKGFQWAMLGVVVVTAILFVANIRVKKI